MSEKFDDCVENGEEEVTQKQDRLYLMDFYRLVLQCTE